MSPREVGASDVLKTAMSLVRSAQKSVRVTMQAVEEIEHPLPREYFLLLREKINNGVKVIRIGFGGTDDFEKIKEQVGFENPNYTFRMTKETDYRRMLLVDDSKLLFAKTDANGRHVFYTEDHSLIKKYTEYFETKLDD